MGEGILKDEGCSAFENLSAGEVYWLKGRAVLVLEDAASKGLCYDSCFDKTRFLS